MERYSSRAQYLRFTDVWKWPLTQIVTSRSARTWDDIKEDDSTSYREDVDEEYQQLIEDRELANMKGNAADAEAVESKLRDLDEKGDADPTGWIDEAAHAFVPYEDEDILQLPACDNVIISENAKRWFEKHKKRDSRYCRFFIKRLRQLADGERSRILQKRLEGGKHTIFETYLEQKCALRVLWTECWESKDGEDDSTVEGTAEHGKAFTLAEKQKLLMHKRLSLFIWGVERHKDVSAKVAKIDASLKKLNRTLVTYHDLGFSGTFFDGNTILINPVTNNPLKSYQLPRSEVGRLIESHYTPHLKMTASENKIVRTNGTVCILGRSGTGKTVCISERMSRDRMTMAEQFDGFRQCMIARSERVRRWVVQQQKNAERDPTDVKYSIEKSTFAVLEDIIDHCRKELPWKPRANGHDGGEPEETRRDFDPAARVDFTRFKEEFLGDALKGRKGYGQINASVAWTQIKSFIKGSIEAVLRWDPEFPQVVQKAKICTPLTRKDYVDPSAGALISATRLKMGAKQRAEYYKVFEEYQQWLKRGSLWDDIDRLFDIFAHQMDPREQILTTEFNRQDHQYHKMYVDEVQDFIQAEVAFMLMMSGPTSLFLAGDNAQSVEEGVVFNFNQVKDVIFAVCNKGVAPKMGEFPTTEKNLLMNFRSHSGVLNIARDILVTMKKAYPDDIDDLAPDAGLCDGKKPYLIELEDENDLYTICKKSPGIVVLTPDVHVEPTKTMCGVNLPGEKTDDSGPSEVEVIGIRESKGMEWDNVAIVNFFQSLETRDQQQAFKRMIEDPAKFNASPDACKYPELPGYMKLLYTAVTRCKMTLVFIETKDAAHRNYAQDKWYRHLEIDEKLAKKETVASLLKTGIGKMTDAEWCGRGVNYAIRSLEFSKDDDAAEREKWLVRRVRAATLKPRRSAFP